MTDLLLPLMSIAVSTPQPPSSECSRHSRWVLVGILLLFLLMRVPLMYRQPGGQDEEWFAVPGWTVAREGVPRIPFVPSRAKASVFYRADEALFALPPVYFYWQAPFFLLLPAGYGTARLASAVAGLIALGLIYRLGRQFYRDETIALWAAGLYSLSRLFFFPAIWARPDMLCGTLGLGAILAAWHWHTTGHTRMLASAGILAGLGLLTHPSAIVYCLQLGAWVLTAGRGLRGRLAAGGVLAGSAAAAFALWTPLILAYPEAFWGQFFPNVLDRSGPGLIGRLLWPWPGLIHQAGLVAEYAQGLQLALMLAGLTVGTVLDWRRAEPGPRVVLALAWSSVYLLVAAVGIHPSNGYWCYPAALVFLVVARTIVTVGRRVVQAASARRIIYAYVAGGLLIVAMLPGAGLRTVVAHLRHWSDPDYRGPTFVHKMLADLPSDARLAVDPAFVFDAYLTGRPVTLAFQEEFYFVVSDVPNDYLIVGPHGRQKRIAERLDAEFLRSYGKPDDPFACWAQVYRLQPGSKQALPLGDKP